MKHFSEEKKDQEASVWLFNAFPVYVFIKMCCITSLKMFL